MLRAHYRLIWPNKISNCEIGNRKFWVLKSLVLSRLLKILLLRHFQILISQVLIRENRMHLLNFGKLQKVNTKHWSLRKWLGFQITPHFLSSQVYVFLYEMSLSMTPALRDCRFKGSVFSKWAKECHLIKRINSWSCRNSLECSVVLQREWNKLRC